MILHMPMTVGDTLESVRASDTNALVVMFRDRESGSWRVGWSKMSLADLCLAKEYLGHCVQEVTTQSYREDCLPLGD